ncbi:MAG TPA: FMN-binding negative transcriptional regulator [Sphingomicrobium sp.]
MHPGPAFAWTDEPAMLAFVGDRGFAHIFVAGPEGARVAHAPLLVTGDGQVQFHLARSNRAASAIAGNRILASVTDLDAYHSANWYASDNQVPTWHYQAVEIEGPAREIDHDALVAQLDALSAKFEGIFQPDNPWTRAKMDPRRFEAFTRAIVGFELAPEAMRGTRKFNQHKSAADIEANLRGLTEAGRVDVADAIKRHWPAP